MYKIVAGEKLGRKLGFPTINLEPVKLEADFGVYACEVVFKNDKKHSGILHYGFRKTVDEKVTLEVHILDFKQEIYEQEVDLIVGKKIREIKKFASLEELKKQVFEDIKNVKNLI